MQLTSEDPIKGSTSDEVYYSSERISFNEVKVTISDNPIDKVSHKAHKCKNMCSS